MGAIHKMAATLGDSPTARVLRGNFSSQRSLPHLAKHFFLGFLFLLRAKKPQTKENLSGSTPLFSSQCWFCFHRAKVSDKDLRELLKPASVGNLWRSSGVWRRYFGKKKRNRFRWTGSHYNRKCHGVSSTSRKTSFFVKFDSRATESWTSLISCSFRCRWLLYTCTVLRSELAR